MNTLTSVIFGLALVSCVSASGTFITSFGLPSISSFQCFGTTVGTDTSASTTSEVDICVVGIVSAVVLAIGLYPGFVPKFDAPFRRRNDIAPPHFANPYPQDIQKAPKADFGLSLKDRLARAYGTLADSLSQSKFYKKVSSSIQSAASSTQSKLVAPREEQPQPTPLS